MTPSIAFINWSGISIEQCCMIEVFAGAAVLCATSKAAGLSGSIARCSIFQLNLVDQRDQALLKQWVDSP